jgi:(p)ppGpp synthase/HD superfamily hydrolase
MILTEQQEKFFEFVKEQHGTQVRKYTGEPYWTHPLAVAELVNKYKSDSFSNGEVFAIEISLGHDLLEDTPCTIETLRKKLSEIGYPYLSTEMIVSGIGHLTDTYTKDAYPKLNRTKRKTMEVERLGRIPAYCQTVKYADLIENLSSIVEHDKSFAITYLQEKKELLKNMRGGNFNLYLKAVEVYLEALKTLERVKGF